MATKIHDINKLGQSVWCDSISRHMIQSGELKQLLDNGIVGMTSNPTIFEKAVSSGSSYDEVIQKATAAGKNADQVFEEIAIWDIGDAADMLRPIYDRTNALDGYISLEVNPHLARNTDGTVKEARHLWKRLNRPNVFIKVPATPEGIPAITTLLGEGINVNVTLIFSLDMYEKVMDAYIKGVEKLAASGGDVTRIASVASFFVSRVDSLADGKLQKKIDAGQSELKSTLGKAAIGNAKLAYQRFKKIFHGDRFKSLAAKGAQVQRPLWASTSTKNPDYSDTMYVDTLIGPETVNTMPEQTIDATIDHAKVAVAIEAELDAYTQAITKMESAGVTMKSVTDELLTDGVKKFADSYDQLIAGVKEKMKQLQTA